MEKTSSVAWHYDSFPFVCVTMASDCTDMVGGEPRSSYLTEGSRRSEVPRWYVSLQYP